MPKLIMSVPFPYRIQMPSMLTSDNLSTWLSTRYATRNKNKTNQTIPEANNGIRHERKKSSSERATGKPDGFVDWLTPKRAKLTDPCPDACTESSSDANMCIDGSRSKYHLCKVDQIYINVIYDYILTFLF